MKDRKSNRLEGYDYSEDGCYFVTICVQGREELFGEIIGGEMVLSEAGEIATARWQWLSERYDYVELDEYVMMPNHFHGILIIQSRRRDRSRPVRGSRACPTPPRLHATRRDDVPTSPGRNRRDRSRPVPTDALKIKSLSELIGAFKTTSSKRIRENGFASFKWQRSFYDHVIRDDLDLNRIREYIRDNPLKWALDEYNPANHATG